MTGKDWKNFNESGEYYAKHYIWDDWEALNQLAWSVYKSGAIRNTLLKAVDWAKRSVELNKAYYNMDTYASILYEIGDYKQASTIATEAIKLGKADSEDTTQTEVLLKKINEKL
jgi:hypothetical protein